MIFKNKNKNKNFIKRKLLYYLYLICYLNRYY